MDVNCKGLCKIARYVKETKIRKVSFSFEFVNLKKLRLDMRNFERFIKDIAPVYIMINEKLEELFYWQAILEEPLKNN